MINLLLLQSSLLMHIRMVRLLIPLFFFSLPCLMMAQSNEWEDLLQAFPEKDARKLLAARYGQDVIQPPNPVSLKALLDDNVGKWVRWPQFGFEVKKIDHSQAINAEVRRFSPDGKYLFVPKNKAIQIYNAESGSYVRKIPLSPDMSHDAVRWHHRLNVLYITHGKNITGYDVDTGNKLQVDYQGPEIGWLSKSGWRAPGGGDANDITAKGYFLLTKGKLDSVQVVRFDDQNPGRIHFVTKTPWKLPEKTDYATVNVNSTGVVVIGLKESGIPVLLYDFEGQLIETLYHSRGHTEQVWYWEGNKKTPATIWKYNQARARENQGNAGDQVLVCYDWQQDKVHIEHKPLISWDLPGQRMPAPNSTAQYSYAGYEGKTLLMALNPPKANFPHHTYAGEVLEASLTSEDPAVRRIMHHLSSKTSPVHFQPEAGINHDGSRMWIKTDMGGLLNKSDQYILLVKLPPRVDPGLRRQLLSGQTE